MTEVSVLDRPLPPAIERFILHWGEMGERWGVNRSVSQIHALLYVSERPLSADDIAESLSMARSNVSTSLKELVGWSLVKRVPVMGERRDYYEAEADMLEMIRRIAIGRKARELDPTLQVLRDCVAQAQGDKRVAGAVKLRFAQMLEVMEGVDKTFGEVISLPSPILKRLISMGGTVARFVTPARRAKRG